MWQRVPKAIYTVGDIGMIQKASFRCGSHKVQGLGDLPWLPTWMGQAKDRPGL